MIYIAFAILLGFSFGLGYFLRTFQDRLKIVEKEVKTKITKPVEEAKSTLIDPDDPIAEAQYELEQQMRDINPDE